MLKTVVAAALLSAIGSVGAVDAATVASLRWEKRIVIVFAADRSKLLSEQQQGLLADKAALADRDLVAFAVVGEEILPIFGEPPRGETAAKLRDRYDVAADTTFSALLIGKDGGVKWRGSKPIALADLNGLIDAMPMRRSAR